MFQFSAKLLKQANPTQVNSPEFKAWFRGSKVVNKDGSPKVVYHGSMSSFDRFDMKAPGMNEEGFYGKGFYFTDSQQDVNRNYSSEDGPDYKNKIERMAEKLLDDGKIWNPKYEKFMPEPITSGGEVDPETGIHYDWDDLREAAIEIVKSQIGGDHKGTVYMTYLKMERPVVVSPQGGTYFEFYRYNERTEEDIELPAGRKLHQILSGISPDLWEEFAQNMDYRLMEGCSAYEVQKAIRECNYLYDYSEDGPGPILRALFQGLGFDGIIQAASAQFQNMGMMPGTNHYIVWKPTQIKSAIGNSGKFNPRSPRMTASEEE